MKKEHFWIALVVAAAIVAVAFFYFRSKKKPAEEKKNEPQPEVLLPSGGAGFSAGDVSALIADAVASVVPVTYVPAPVRYREVVQRRATQPVRHAFRPLTGTNTVTTPAGNTAVIAPNPNAPRFN